MLGVNVRMTIRRAQKDKKPSSEGVGISPVIAKHFERSEKNRRAGDQTGDRRQKTVSLRGGEQSEPTKQSQLQVQIASSDVNTLLAMTVQSALQLKLGPGLFDCDLYPNLPSQ